jgi:hypothetical protein
MDALHLSRMSRTSETRGDGSSGQRFVAFSVITLYCLLAPTVPRVKGRHRRTGRDWVTRVPRRTINEPIRALHRTPAPDADLRAPENPPGAAPLPRRRGPPSDRSITTRLARR